MTNGGRALSKSKGAGFVARNWLENDGDGSLQPDAAKRWGQKTMQVGGVEIVHLSGKRAVAGMAQCSKNQIVVASVDIEHQITGGCTLYDPKKLRLTGAVALRNVNGTLNTITVRQTSGARLWTHWKDTGHWRLPVVSSFNRCGLNQPNGPAL